MLAILFAAISIGGLTLPSTYVRETANWGAQAVAQDWFDLVAASPAIVIATWFASRGSRRSQIALAGIQLYAVYTIAIYCFAVHLNALFLLYCAAFGVSLYALIPLASSLLREDASRWFDSTIPRRTASGVLIATAVAFGGLWLAQLVPAAASGTPPREIVETGLLTNPIHVLDLSFILPLHVVAGVALLGRRSIGFVLAPALLAFGVLMTGSIAFLQVVLELRGLISGGLPIAIAMAMLAALSAILVVLLLRGLRSRTGR